MTDADIIKLIDSRLAYHGLITITDDDQEQDVDGISQWPHDKTLTRWEANSDHWVFHPQAIEKGCLWMCKDWMSVTKKIISETHTGNHLVITDCCSQYGTCPGHNNLHSGANGRTWDACYPTYSPVAEPLTDIYKDGDLDPDVFDWQRFANICLSVRKHSPDAVIMCGTQPWDYVNDRLPGLEWFKCGIQHIDSWNHQTHFHITYGQRLIWVE